MSADYTPLSLFAAPPATATDDAPRYGVGDRVRMHDLTLVWRVLARGRELDVWRYAVAPDALAAAVEAEGGMVRAVGWYFEHELEAV